MHLDRREVAVSYSNPQIEGAVIVDPGLLGARRQCRECHEFLRTNDNTLSLQPPMHAFEIYRPGAPHQLQDPTWAPVDEDSDAIRCIAYRKSGCLSHTFNINYLMLNSVAIRLCSTDGKGLIFNELL